MYIVIYIYIYIHTYTLDPRLSEPNGRQTIWSDNRGVQIDEGRRNSPSIWVIEWAIIEEIPFICTKYW